MMIDHGFGRIIDNGKPSNNALSRRRQDMQSI